MGFVGSDAASADVTVKGGDLYSHGGAAQGFLACAILIAEPCAMRTNVVAFSAVSFRRSPPVGRPGLKKEAPGCSAEREIGIFHDAA